MLELEWFLCHILFASPAICPANAQHKPHADMYSSIKDDLIEQCTHDHSSFADDNQRVYLKIEEATRDTKFAATIRYFKNDGRGAYLALLAQHAGDDKRQEIICKSDHILHNQEWKGQSNYSLEKHCQAH